MMKVDYTRVSSIDSSQDTGLDTQIQIVKRHRCERISAESQSRYINRKETSREFYIKLIKNITNLNILALFIQ